MDKVIFSMSSYLGSRRCKDHGGLPHANVYTRLRPSTIHGVGVFAIRRIEKGTPLFAGDEDIVWVDQGYVADLPKKIKKLYDDFAIIKDGKYGCPTNFNLLTMGWYLNDSDDPNVAVDDEYNMSALRDIEEGEELTIDSSKFSEQPYKKISFK
jgi:SET domain-containing protein